MSQVYFGSLYWIYILCPMSLAWQRLFVTWNSHNMTGTSCDGFAAAAAVLTGLFEAL